MTLSTEAKRKFDFLEHTLQTTGKHSHHGHPADYRRAVRTYIDLYRSGDNVDPMDVEEWAIESGWPKKAAWDLRQMGLTVKEALSILDEE